MTGTVTKPTQPHIVKIEMSERERELLRDLVGNMAGTHAMAIINAEHPSVPSTLSEASCLIRELYELLYSGDVNTDV